MDDGRRGGWVEVQAVYPELVDVGWVQGVFGVLYSAVWALAVSGNGLVVYVALRHSNVSFSVRTVFILSLACSDLLIGLVALPTTAVSLFSRVWVFPLFLCPPIGTILGSGIYISSFTFSAIAVDSERRSLTYGQARGFVGLFWGLGYLATLITSFFTKAISYREARSGRPFCGHFCEERWPAPIAQTIYGAVSTGIQFSVPLVISLFCYISIAQKISAQAKTMARRKADTSFEIRMARRRSHTNRMMIMMVACFAMSYAPLNAFNVVRDFAPQLLRHFPNASTFYAVCHLISTSSILFNPIIYGWFNENFRAAVREALGLKAKRPPGKGKTPKGPRSELTVSALPSKTTPTSEIQTPLAPTSVPLLRDEASADLLS